MLWLAVTVGGGAWVSEFMQPCSLSDVNPQWWTFGCDETAVIIVLACVNFLTRESSTPHPSRHCMR